MGAHVTNPLGNYLSGVITAHGIAERIHQEARAQQQFEMQQAMQQQEQATREQQASMQDIQTRLMLQQAGRPVVGGTVQDIIEGRIPDAAGNFAADINPEHVASYLRKPEPSRLVTYKSQTGPLQYELYTPEEQMQRQRELLSQQSYAEALAKADAAQRVQNYINETYGAPLASSITEALSMAPGTKVPLEQIPALAQKAAEIAEKRAQAGKAALITTGKDQIVWTPSPTGGAPTVFARGPAGEPPQPTTPSLYVKAAQGDPLAKAALANMQKDLIARRPVTTFVAPSNAPAGPVTIDQVPEDIRPTVQRIGTYRGKMPPLGRNNVTNQRIQFWLGKTYPKYDETKFETKNAMRKDYEANGPQGKEIGGIVTGLGHVGALGDAIDALNNSNLPLMNRIAQAVGLQIGKDPVTVFNTIVHKVAPELNKAYGGSGAVEEIKKQESDFNPALGDTQLRSNLRTTVKLLDSKIQYLAQRWNRNEMGSDFFDEFFTPEARATLANWMPAASAPASAPANPYANQPPANPWRNPPK